MIYLIIDVHYQNVCQNTCQNGNQDISQDNYQGEATAALATTNTTSATVAGIRFTGITKNTVLSEHIVHLDTVADYQSGQFYKREMPCILALLATINPGEYDVLIIDGYVYLDGENQAGLGKYLYDALLKQGIDKPIIGIAKNKFYAISDEYAIYRGKSKQPLYVTHINSKLSTIDKKQALLMVTDFAGTYRLPTVVKLVDKLCRNA